MSFLHNFQPESILFTLGPITIYWYGLFMVISIILALIITTHLAKRYDLKPSLIIDLAFWLILFGFIGARLYELIIDFDYYYQNPLAIVKIWQGGLAIHGAIITGLITLYLFSKNLREKLSQSTINIFWKLTAIIVPGLALGQAVGRWGNYFNQELFGLPSNLPWAIPITLFYRPIEYISINFFHPTFLYESIGCLIIFIVLMIYHKKIKNQINPIKHFIRITALYLLLYSVLRFSLEFLRLDPTLTIFNWRWPQIISIILILISIYLFFISRKHEKDIQTN